MGRRERLMPHLGRRNRLPHLYFHRGSWAAGPLGHARRLGPTWLHRAMGNF
jgi:hypothetical protein